MIQHQEKTSENKTQVTAANINRGTTAVQLKDNREYSVVQKKLSEKIADQESSPASIQRKNNTGLPNNLKSEIENLSGHSMDDVKVHYNSSQPAQLNAHAYAQGSDIHIASGQEKHLPHEAWHVVQQKQGRVKPTLQMKGKVNINDDKGLENEADVMGVKATQLAPKKQNLLELTTPKSITFDESPVQGVFKELAIAALILFGNIPRAGWQSDNMGMIGRRPLTHKLGVNQALNTLGTGLPTDHLVSDLDEHPLNLGLFHAQVFHNSSNFSDNIGMFDSGLEADSPEMLDKYIPYIEGLDSKFLRMSTETIRDRWKEKKYSVTSANCQRFAREVYQQYLQIAPDKPQKSWSVYVADKIVEFDDATVGHINNNVKADIDKKLTTEYRKKLKETLKGNRFAALSMHNENLSDNIDLTSLIEYIMNVVSEKSKKEIGEGVDPIYTIDFLNELVLLFGKKEIESQIPTPAEWRLSKRLVELIARKVATEIYRVLSNL
ncbi:DUF4157 domain-containing protein [Flavobacterium sp. Root420]|uniref:eCIS core domain-containing protein n=1 Tax=Flavobacterium sp. Root420 TaxID=1736533 RepID=UPI0009EC7E20|nr:DUF4157 domain-containing protein [Flavobacterium sp. Root420]